MSPAGARGRLDVNIKQKSFRAASGGNLHVLGELTFSLRSGGVAALVGPSGCEKTTLLRFVAGLDRDFDGNVAFPAHGPLAMVFQEPRLLPWRTVEQNVRLAAPRATDAGLEMLFQTLGLETHRDHYPGELSLGLARRVALARAFAAEPDLLLGAESLEKTIGIEVVAAFRCQRRLSADRGDDDCHLAPCQIGCQRRQSIGLTLRVTMPTFRPSIKPRSLNPPAQ
jgi:ABC-type lipoprotein export system ATPase subunit